MNIGDLFLTNPNQLELLNNGVAFVKDVVTPEELKTLRFELKTFVCEGEYSKGLEKILRTFIGNLDRPEQPAAWVSGFYGSGKSHLTKILRYLWTDFEFPEDKAQSQGPDEAVHRGRRPAQGVDHGGQTPGRTPRRVRHVARGAGRQRAAVAAEHPLQVGRPAAQIPGRPVRACGSGTTASSTRSRSESRKQAATSPRS